MRKRMVGSIARRGMETLETSSGHAEKFKLVQLTVVGILGVNGVHVTRQLGSRGGQEQCSKKLGLEENLALEMTAAKNPVLWIASATLQPGGCGHRVLEPAEQEQRRGEGTAWQPRTVALLVIAILCERINLQRDSKRSAITIRGALNVLLGSGHLLGL